MTLFNRLDQRCTHAREEAGPRSSSRRIRNRTWDFANDPAQWMASNPEEQYGTEFFTPDNKVATGGRFHQRESVAGVRADMKGHFLHVDRPRNVSWTGVAEYRFLGGLLRFRVPQSRILTLDPRADGVMTFWEARRTVPHEVPERREAALRARPKGTRLLQDPDRAAWHAGGSVDPEPVAHE